jgi:hypothetical protein
MNFTTAFFFHSANKKIDCIYKSKCFWEFISINKEHNTVSFSFSKFLLGKYELVTNIFHILHATVIFYVEINFHVKRVINKYFIPANPLTLTALQKIMFIIQHVEQLNLSRVIIVIYI